MPISYLAICHIDEVSVVHNTENWKPVTLFALTKLNMFRKSYYSFLENAVSLYCVVSMYISMFMLVSILEGFGIQLELKQSNMLDKI